MRRAAYWVMRGLAIGLGLLLLVSGGMSAFAPDTLHSDGPPPSRIATLTRGITYLVLAVALLLPLRWRLPVGLARVRATLFVITALLVTYLACDGLLGYFRGERHWLILPTLTVTLLAGWSAVGALLMRRSTPENGVAGR
ncbi:MAG TPA: hypothetical protein VJV75_10675 [Candidatus Polarisedimenticolia bacterium]|nr:hypothetical protein [Candidatus Polarisedimenticolia bacterium]